MFFKINLFCIQVKFLSCCCCSYRPPPDFVPQRLELRPVQLSDALALDKTPRSRKRNVKRVPEGSTESFMKLKTLKTQPAPKQTNIHLFSYKQTAWTAFICSPLWGKIWFCELKTQIFKFVFFKGYVHQDHQTLAVLQSQELLTSCQHWEQQRGRRS